MHQLARDVLMLGLPQNKPPVGFQKYKPTGIPKSKERLRIGRSNRPQYESQQAKKLEKVFLDPKSQQRLNTGTRHAESYYTSAKTINDILVYNRHAAHLLGGEGVRGREEESSIRPPPSPRPPAPACLEAAKSHIRELEVHPSVGYLRYFNAVGKGHQIAPENFFLKSATPLYTYPPENPHNTYPARPFIIPEGHHTNNYGGGILEYNDPVNDEYSHNPGLSRFAIGWENKPYVNVKGEPIAIPWRDDTETNPYDTLAASHQARLATPQHQPHEGVATSRDEKKKGDTTPSLPASIPHTFTPTQQGGDHPQMEELPRVSPTTSQPPVILQRETAAGPTSVQPQEGKNYDILTLSPALSVGTPSSTGRGGAGSGGAGSVKEEKDCSLPPSPPTHPTKKPGPSSHAAAPVRSTVPFCYSTAPEYENRMVPQDEWVKDYVPSARPWDVPHFLGRCGYKDTRLTFVRVQADEKSSMHPTTAEQYSSVAQHQLSTPSDWQQPRSRVRRFPNIPK